MILEFLHNSLTGYVLVQKIMQLFSKRDKWKNKGVC